MAKRSDQLVKALDELVKQAEGNKPCRLCVELEKLPAPVAAVTRKAIDSSKDGRYLIGARKLIPILKEAGLDVSYRVLDSHRLKGHQ